VPFDLSMGEFLVILFVALLVFGGRLPETARKVGSALSEFKRGMREELRKVEDGVRTDGAPPEWRRPTAEPPAEGPAPGPTRRDP
jgi:TatA/E family protein of Tat protein translocase